ncbi:MAG: BON domain-containing protein [Thermoguttaceae bacterium]
MRRLLIALVVAAVAALVPTWAVAGNQEFAERIAASLKESGKLHGYKIGVKYQDGTVWLRGQVSSQEQMDTALQLVFQMPGVTRVVNNLVVASEEGSEGSALRQPSSVAGTPTHRVEQAIAEAVATLSPAGGQSPQPVRSAIAAEQLPRPVGRDIASAPTQRALVVPSAQAAGTPPVAKRAERVPSSFVVSAAQQTNAVGLEEPTLAPARPIAAAEMPAPPQALPVSMPAPASNVPLPIAQTGVPMPLAGLAAQPAPSPGALPAGASAVRYDQPNLPQYAWPGYAAYPNYAAVTYPKQYSPTAWPYIGPFYPYPQVPLGWRKVTLEWHDGWWHLDFDDGSAKGPFSGLFRPCRRH